MITNHCPQKNLMRPNIEWVLMVRVSYTPKLTTPLDNRKQLKRHDTLVPFSSSASPSPFILSLYDKKKRGMLAIRHLHSQPQGPSDCRTHHHCWGDTFPLLPQVPCPLAHVLHPPDKKRSFSSPSYFFLHLHQRQPLYSLSPPWINLPCENCHIVRHYGSHHIALTTLFRRNGSKSLS